MTQSKTTWSGVIETVQPRIRLERSFDESYHVYVGFILWVRGQRQDKAGTVEVYEERFGVAIGKKTQEKHEFRSGDEVAGLALPVTDPRMETAELYKASAFQLISRGKVMHESPPPTKGIPPTLEKYRQRGHRRLAARTYSSRCLDCLWGCKMPVIMTIDHWNPGPKRYRFETFCYGPKNCRKYLAGPTRKVPGRRGMTWEEEDWVDEDNTSHREPDE